MSKIIRPELNVEALTNKIEEAVMRRKANGHEGQSAIVSSNELSSRPDAPSFFGEETLKQIASSPLRLQGEFQARDDHHYHLSDLTRYHDAAFVLHAYEAILQRPPDAVGFNSYLENLRQGRYNKVDILAGMRFSPEGAARGVSVAGLRWPAFIRRFGRVPILGYIVRVGLGIARLPVLVRHHQQLEAYTVSQQQQIADHLNRTNKTLAELMEQSMTLNDRQVKELSRADAAAAAHDDQLSRTLAEQTQRLGAFQNHLVSQQSDLERQSAHLTEAKEWLRSQSAQLQDQEERLSEQSVRLTTSADELRREINSAVNKLQQTRRELIMQERRVSLLLEEARRSPENYDAARTQQILAAEENSLHDSFYASFEDLFRGTREDIRNRLRVHLATLNNAGITANVLDIGCGRGEWLELLRDEGIAAAGVDLNRIFVEDCRARGLEVVQQDAIAHLRAIPDGSLRAVTSFHLIEHLPFKILVTLLDEILRTLRPGGCVIFETPNPENVMVGSHLFYTDPTHRNPLPSSTVEFLLEARGFNRIKITRLHPQTEARLAGTSEIIERFNDYFYGPMDYAIVGWKV